MRRKWLSRTCGAERGILSHERGGGEAKLKCQARGRGAKSFAEAGLNIKKFDGVVGRRAQFFDERCASILKLRMRASSVG